MKGRYLLWSFVAMASYSIVAPLLKIAMRDLPSTPAVFMSNSVMFLLVLVVLAYTGESPRRYLTRPGVRYYVALGVILTVGLLAYYRAIALGPVSVVVPIFGLYIAASSIIAIVTLDESVTTRKVVGIGLGVLAIGLITL